MNWQMESVEEYREQRLNFEEYLPFGVEMEEPDVRTELPEILERRRE